jgi:hypothetical protein
MKMNPIRNQRDYEAALRRVEISKKGDILIEVNQGTF